MLKALSYEMGNIKDPSSIAEQAFHFCCLTEQDNNMEGSILLTFVFTKYDLSQ